MILLLMGVCGSGKTTIGRMLAEYMEIEFVDADDCHSAANKAKMAAGKPLNDDDRQPWLEALNELLRETMASGKSLVLACSALKEKYRRMLESGMPARTLRFVFLDASPELLRERLAFRRHDFLNPELLASQFATLEVPAYALRVVNDREPDQIVAEIVEYLSLR